MGEPERRHGRWRTIISRNRMSNSYLTHPVDKPKAPTDALFAAKQQMVGDFNFGAKTAAVFDDMLDRSVPYYSEIQRIMGELAADFALPDTNLYDLGCSTGTTLVQMNQVLPA